ncbi:lantibiotic dehydratase [Nonomuraea typhae]|uniref:Lantibiotic dehydratase n=1 Tax=Nonomuraea typhae TaxID=2603600 RepID=A0ABW7YUS8_9ACTN
MTVAAGLRPALDGPVITRVGGVPTNVLDLVPDTTRALSREAADLTDALRRLASPLTEALFTLVPRLDEQVTLRRAVLSGKRSVHGLRALPWDDDVFERVAARLPETAALLRDWAKLTDKRAAVLDALRSQLDQDRVVAVAKMRAALWEPGVLESLTVAAPDWVRHADLAALTPRSVKTLYSYVSRTAVKTSPFSGLTAVGVAGLRGQSRAISRTAVVLAALAVQRLARDPRTAPLLSYRGAPIRPGGDRAPRGLMLHGEILIAGGIVWRQDRVVEADHATRWLDGLGDRDLTLAEILARVGGADPFARFVRLLDAGVFTPVPPWRQDAPPLPGLAELVGECPNSPIPADDLCAAHRLGLEARDADVHGRLAALDGLAQYARTWSAPAQGRTAPLALLYEDRETDADLPDVCAAGPVRDDLLALGERMRPYIFRSHVYDLMLQRFTAAFGAGAACRDPLAFLMGLAIEGDGDGPLDTAITEDVTARANPGDRAWLPVGPTSARPSAAVLFQLAAPSAQQATQGDYRLVVNQFSAGSGALFARFAGLLGVEFRDRLREYVMRARPGIECRELVLWTDCNTAQAECAGLLPPLTLPGEPTRASGITLDDMLLVHDAATDTLSLTDQSGAPVGLAYLGLVPQHMMHSYARLLAVLADPWVNGAPQSDYTLTRLPELLPRCCPDEVVALPRDGFGRVVTRRASWLVPVTALPLPRERDGVDDLKVALQLYEFRRTHGMPEEVFVHQLGFTGGDRKPLWVSLAAPLSAQVLGGWLDAATTHVRVTEALPARDAHPQLDPQGRPRAVEHAAMLTWLR